MGPLSQLIGKLRGNKHDVVATEPTSVEPPLSRDASTEAAGSDAPVDEKPQTANGDAAAPSPFADLDRAAAAIKAPPPEPVDPDALRERVIETLREIYDPEIPVNIYDLGLIYEVEVSPEGGVDVEMTLTTPGCPVAATFPGTVEAMVASIPEVVEARVELVWDPPWTMDRMPEEVKLQLGLL